MPKSTKQKYRLLEIVRILKEETDIDHPITTQEFCSRLEQEGITCDRRTLSRDISELVDLGYEISDTKIEEGKAIPLTNYPLLVAEWFDDADINDYSHGSMKKAKWKCSVCGNVFYQIIKNRTKQGQGCPICGNKRKADANKREVKNLETGEVFPSIKEAAKAYHVSMSAIGNCVNGKIQTCRGYHWAFSKDGIIDPSDEMMDQLSFE